MSATLAKRCATATLCGARSLHVSHACLARKQAGGSSLRSNIGHPAYDEAITEMSLTPLKPYQRDGLTSYQAKMVTEAVLVRSYLEKVQHELPKLAQVLNPEPYRPPESSAYLKFKTVDHPTDPRHPMAAKVALTVSLSQVADVEKLTPAQQHNLKLLSGSRYDPIADLIHFSSTRYPFRSQNKRWLADTFATLLKEAKAANEQFLHVAVDTRHAAKRISAKEKAKSLELPKEWLEISAATCQNDVSKE